MCCWKAAEAGMEILEQLSTYVQQGRMKNVTELAGKALEDGIPAQQILEDGLMAGMNVIGEKFKRGDVYVPEVLIAARAMNAGIDVLKPSLAGEGGTGAPGKAVIGTVQGDMHDIGKNLVKIMLEGKGIEVIDLGVNVPAARFVETAVKEGAQIIVCSALLTTTMPVMGDVVKAAKEQGVRDQVKIMVGGAPVTEEFCRQIGADRYTDDAASAADAAMEFLQNTAAV